MALLITEQDVSRILTMDMAIEAVEEGFRQQATGAASNSPRRRLPLNGGFFNFMSAAAPGLGVMGTKSYGARRGARIKFYVYLYSIETGELLALIEASSLGQIRTGAASGVATRHMARVDASTVGVIGSGYQAETQLEAVCRVRDIRSARVFSRNEENRRQFAEKMSARLGFDITPAASAEECVRDADIAIAITSSSSPVINGEWLRLGAHVNAAGGNHWMRRELDTEAIKRASVIVVDDLDQAKIECGDLIHPIDLGVRQWRDVRELADVISGATPGRHTPQDISVFESQGVALEDIAVGVRLYEVARERAIGVQLPL